MYLFHLEQQQQTSSPPIATSLKQREHCDVENSENSHFTMLLFECLANSGNMYCTASTSTATYSLHGDSTLDFRGHGVDS